MVDLTHSFGTSTPVWAGFGQATMTTAADSATHQPYTIEKDGFRTTFYSMVGQYGTHVDAPAHFDPNGVTMDKIPLKEMILPLVVLDETPLLAGDPNHAFSVDDLNSTLAIFRIPEQIQWFSGSGLEASSPCFATVFFCKWPKSSSETPHQRSDLRARPARGGPTQLECSRFVLISCITVERWHPVMVR